MKNYNEPFFEPLVLLPTNLTTEYNIDKETFFYRLLTGKGLFLGLHAINIQKTGLIILYCCGISFFEYSSNKQSKTLRLYFGYLF